ncbi:Fibronectin type 3 and ankyrin repeat domains protein 1 [Beauveria bassiana]|uniref:Fibronectin type 3 and ankyrin repeat domains protein 1 n=1 Tax=Beauveria bassiana TaxID=176275 RepID=A0A2N6N895_BEABA|nr:Fibronectin type 3 and ankyrin repeat domains protein 1 [Beauveria bassiana]
MPSSSRRAKRRAARPGRPKTVFPAAAPAASPAKRRQPVYRVRGVPPELDRAGLAALLESHKDLSGCGLGIHTLAANADGHQTATIFFTNDKIPPSLSALGRRDSLAVDVEIAVDDAAPDSRCEGAKRKRDEPQTAKLRIDALFLGLTVLYTPPKVKHHFDVLAVHGLGGSHPYGSFVSRRDGHMWLKDDLPRIIPSARVIIYGYDTKLADNDDCAQLCDLGGGLHLAMINLWQEARPASTKPLVLIGLSLGGLLVKEALIQLSKSSLWPELGTVTGVLLFGAPNDGMSIKSFGQIVRDNSNRPLLDTLNPLNSDALINQNTAFKQLLRRATFGLFCFWEQLQSPTARMTPGGHYSMDGPLEYTVTKFSATSCLPPGAPLERTVGMLTNHSGLVKFSRHDPEFEKVKPILMHMCHGRRGAAAADSLPSLTAAEKECQAALSFVRCETRRHDIKDAVAGTCEWLFAHEEYKRWCSCPKGLLWVKGIAGAGKSTLLRHALGRIKALHSAGEAPLVLDFFFDRQGDALQKSTLGLFRSLLHQVLTWAPHTLAAFVDAFRQRSAADKAPPDDAAKWPEGDLKAALRWSLAAALQERPVWLLVDALDESGDEATAVGIVDEFKTLLDGVSADGFPLRIIFTARQHLKLDSEYRFEISVQSNNEADIATFVKARLSMASVAETSILVHLITKRAHGLFLWAALVVGKARALQNAGKGLASILRMVDETPAELAAVYCQILQSLVAAERPLTRKLFQWMCFAQRPLTVDEMRWALVVDAECSYESLAECDKDDEFDSNIPKRVAHISRGLVVAESPLPSPFSLSAQAVVRFIHQTIPDYLLSDEGALTFMHDEPTATRKDVARLAHYQLSRTCIRYLRMKEIAQLPADDFDGLSSQDKLSSTFPLFAYATRSWPAHAQWSDQSHLVSSLGWPSDPFIDRWLHIYCRVRRQSFFLDRWVHFLGRMTAGSPPATLRGPPPKNISVLHLAAQYGLQELLTTTLEAGIVAVDTRNAVGRTPLFYAVINGHRELVQVLLRAGADQSASDNMLRDALSFAAQFGHADIVGDLVAHGAGVNARNATGVTALHWAALGPDETTLQVLVEAGADVGAKTSSSSMPLEWAIEVGNEQSVAMLLKIRPDVNRSYGLWHVEPELDTWVCTHDAHKATANIHMMDRVNTWDQRHGMWTPLSRAVHKGSVVMAQMLLDNGAWPHLPARSGPSPQYLARELGNQEMISRLESRRLPRLVVHSPRSIRHENKIND